MNYYYCGYGHVLRLSSKVSSASEAARDTFGTTDVTCLNVGGRHPKYMTIAKRNELKKKLILLHAKKTGYKIEL